MRFVLQVDEVTANNSDKVAIFSFIYSFWFSTAFTCNLALWVYNQFKSMVYKRVAAVHYPSKYLFAASNANISSVSLRLNLSFQLRTLRILFTEMIIDKGIECNSSNIYIYIYFIYYNGFIHMIFYKVIVLKQCAKVKLLDPR
jgi:hypothetical protein